MLTFIYITWSVKNAESWPSPRLTELEYLDVMSRNLCLQQAPVVLMQVVLPTLRINAIQNAGREVGKTHAK